MTEYTTETLTAMKTIDLRKLAKAEFGLKGLSSARKENLVPAILQEQKAAELAREIEDNEADDQGKIRYSGRIEDPKPVNGKAVRTSKGVKGKLCAECGTQPVDRKTQGRDSTMCNGCYEYAGWENTHSDNGHESVNLSTASSATVNEMNDCPVCQAAIRSTQVRSANGISPKALAFEKDAQDAGWSALARLAADGSGVSLVTATASDGRELELRWNGKVCVDGQNYFKRADGKRVKVRNASAARKLLANA